MPEDEFVPPPAGEPIPAPGPSDRGAPDLPDPPDDDTEYVDPLDSNAVAHALFAAAVAAPTAEQVLAYARTFKGVAQGRTGENRNTFTRWYYGDDTAASFCLIFICYVFDHFGVLGRFFDGKIAYCPNLRTRVGAKFHIGKPSIAAGDPVLFDFNKSGEPEHVGMFVKWLDSDHTEFESWEANTTGGGSTDWIGAKTRRWTDVYGYVKPGYAPPDPSKYPGIVYKYVQGALQSGSHIRWIQQRLGIHGHKVTVDGQYGPKTAAAVKAFQHDAKLTTDGQVGPKTWGALAK
jgi:hypothetical protein